MHVEVILWQSLALLNSAEPATDYIAVRQWHYHADLQLRTVKVNQKGGSLISVIPYTLPPSHGCQHTVGKLLSPLLD